MKKMLLPVTALLLAVGFSAFTTVKQATSGKVWFKLNHATGQPMNASAGGLQSASDPFSCTEGSEPCAISLDIDNQVVDNGNGTYGIAPGVDPSTDYIDRDYEEVQ